MEALQKVALQLGLDNTFFPIFGLIFLLYFLMRITYLKPYQNHLDNRKSKTDGAKKEALELMAKAQEVLEEYKAKLKQTNDRAQKIMSEIEAEAKKQEATLIAEASVKSKTSLQTIQKQLDGIKGNVLNSLSKDIPGIAAEIATKVLGRGIS